MHKCTACGAHNLIESQYCQACGHLLEPQVSISCRACGIALDSHATQCFRCGQKLESIPPDTFPETLNSTLQSPVGAFQGKRNAQSRRELLLAQTDSKRGSGSIARARLQRVLQQDRLGVNAFTPLENSIAPEDSSYQATFGSDQTEPGTVRRIVEPKDLGHPSARIENTQDAIIEPDSLTLNLSSAKQDQVSQTRTRGSRLDGLQLALPVPDDLDLNKMVTLQEILRMANANGIYLDRPTFRAWQQAWLVPLAREDPSTTQRRTRKYYPVALLFRLNFIYQGSKQYALDLDKIREALYLLDEQHFGNPTPADYLACLEKFRTEHTSVSEESLLKLVAKQLDLPIQDITGIIIQRKTLPPIEIKSTRGSA